MLNTMVYSDFNMEQPLVVAHVQLMSLINFGPFRSIATVLVVYQTLMYLEIGI